MVVVVIIDKDVVEALRKHRLQWGLPPDCYHSSYSKRARGTSANKEFSLCGVQGLWRVILSLSFPPPSTQKFLLFPAHPQSSRFLSFGFFRKAYYFST